MIRFERIASLLVDNFGWKLLSLAIASGLWLAIVADSELTTAISAPVQYRNTPAELEISSDLPERVSLEIRGPSRRLRRADTVDVVCQLDLSQVQSPGERSFTIRAGQIAKLPAGVTLARAIPAQLRLTFERRITHQVPVQLRLAGPPRSGLHVARFTIDPERVAIVGPKSRVELVTAVQTDPLDLSSAGADTEFRTHVFTGNPQVRIESSSLVTVRIILEKNSGGPH